MEPVTRQRAPLDGEVFDVVVIGGGISGVAIARACARSRWRTLLVEQNDFASGTTSRSTRIIHGGLRYLEHGDIALVREALAEREHLLSEHPHIVRPMQFLLALHPNAMHNAMTVRAGLWMYRRMAARVGAHAHVSTGSARRELESMLDAGGRWTVYSYEDAQCEFPERLIAEWLTEAVAAGAVVRNHTHALKVQRKAGRVHGVMLRDALDGAEYSVEADWIVNATGPWADHVISMSGIVPNERLVGGVRGSHIVLPRFEGAPDHAVYCEAEDGRPIFVIPWNGMMLVGTTETSDSADPGQAKPAEDEIDYLLRSVNAALPQARATRRKIVYAFAGVRPLPFAPGKPLAALTRKHILHDHSAEGAAGMISVIGGKLTTAAALARDVARAIGIAIPQPPITIEPAPAAEELEQAFNLGSRQIAQLGHLPKTTARAMAEWYGVDISLAIARLARISEAARAPLCPHTSHVVAEALYGMAEEFAVTMSDTLLRRVPVALGRCWTQECSRAAAAAIGQAAGWNWKRIETEIEQLEQERSRFLIKPAEQSQGKPSGAAA
jgi:glycerol-3-phosphate dehydrogenase